MESSLLANLGAKRSGSSSRDEYIDNLLVRCPRNMQVMQLKDLSYAFGHMVWSFCEKLRPMEDILFFEVRVRRVSAWYVTGL